MATKKTWARLQLQAPTVAAVPHELPLKINWKMLRFCRSVGFGVTATELYFWIFTLTLLCPFWVCVVTFLRWFKIDQIPARGCISWHSTLTLALSGHFRDFEKHSIFSLNISKHIKSHCSSPRKAANCQIHNPNKLYSSFRLTVSLIIQQSTWCNNAQLKLVLILSAKAYS